MGCCGQNRAALRRRLSLTHSTSPIAEVVEPPAASAGPPVRLHYVQSRAILVQNMKKIFLILRVPLSDGSTWEPTIEDLRSYVAGGEEFPGDLNDPIVMRAIVSDWLNLHQGRMFVGDDVLRESQPSKVRLAWIEVEVPEPLPLDAFGNEFLQGHDYVSPEKIHTSSVTTDVKGVVIHRDCPICCQGLPDARTPLREDAELFRREVRGSFEVQKPGDRTATEIRNREIEAADTRRRVIKGLRFS